MTDNGNIKISMIAAIGQKTRVLADENGEIPWHISEDFKYFKETTMGHPMIMGRKTFETFRKPLPGRTHIVITRQPDYEAPEGVIVVDSLEKAIKEAQKIEKEEIFIIGGGQIYTQGMELADRLYLTLVDVDQDGPIKFPEYSEMFTRQVSSRKSRDENFEFEFVILEK